MYAQISDVNIVELALTNDKLTVHSVRELLQSKCGELGHIKGKYRDNGFIEGYFCTRCNFVFGIDYR